jgi:hypothetical protein
MYSDFHFYIDLNWEDVIDKTIDVYLNKLYQLVNFAYQHKASVFYSTEHLNEFKSMLEIERNIDEDFSASIGNKLDVILRHAKGKDIKSYAFQVCFANNNTSIFHINNVLSVVDQHSKIAVLSLSNMNKINCFLQVRSNTSYCKIDCENLHATDEIIYWIANTEVRPFNLSSKHGENGKGNWQGESLLLCTKEDAQKLLNTAIPCFEEKEKNLFNFDNTHNTFIVFYYEGDNPQRQWHGFHLERGDWHKVPNFVLKYFGK